MGVPFVCNEPLVWQRLPEVGDEAPSCIALLPNFVQLAKQAKLQRQLSEQLDWQQRNIILFGKSIPQPRLVCSYGSVSYRYSGLTLPAAAPPTLLADMLRAVNTLCDHSFNSVLGNYYRNGDDYMGWHQDNEASLGNHPTVASVTLGARRKFVLKHKQTSVKRELWLESGTLLVMAGGCQHYWLHALPKTKRVTEPRLNFTFRRICT